MASNVFFGWNVLQISKKTEEEVEAPVNMIGMQLKDRNYRLLRRKEHGRRNIATTTHTQHLPDLLSRASFCGDARSHLSLSESKHSHRCSGNQKNHLDESPQHIWGCQSFSLSCKCRAAGDLREGWRRCPDTRRAWHKRSPRKTTRGKMDSFNYDEYD